MNVSIACLPQHGLEVRRLKELLVPSLSSPVLLLDLVSGLAGWGNDGSSSRGLKKLAPLEWNFDDLIEFVWVKP